MPEAYCKSILQLWGFILPNQRQQMATRMHAFHIPHWRMNKLPCLFHLDQQRHVKKRLFIPSIFWVETELS